MVGGTRHSAGVWLLTEPWRYSRFDVSMFIAVSRYSSDTAESCCIDIPLCAHVRENVSDVSAVSTIRDGVKLGVKVMDSSEVGVRDVVGRCLGVCPVLEDY